MKTRKTITTLGPPHLRSVLTLVSLLVLFTEALPQISQTHTSSGIFSDAFWSPNSGDPGASVTINSGSSVEIQSGNTVTNAITQNIADDFYTAGFPRGDQKKIANTVRLLINSSINPYSDETLVVFSEGTPEINGDDVLKSAVAHPGAPRIATVDDAGQMIAVRAYGAYTGNISIPVTVEVAVNGTYTITATGLSLAGLHCLRLEDLATNTVTPLVEGASYDFIAFANDDPNNARFVLHASAPLQLQTTPATCAGRDDGLASVDVPSGPVDIIWMDAQGAVMLEQNNVQAGNSRIVALKGGAYSVRITSSAGCSDLVSGFVIHEPTALEVEADAMPTSCPATEDGTIDLVVSGGHAQYTYIWSNGSIDSAIEVPAGTYNVEVTDANGCIIAPQDYVVSPGEGPEAGISVESTVALVNDEITFFVLNTNGITNSWDFGDGGTSNELEPTHIFALPGQYTVTLIVDDGDCTATTSLEVTVESTTGLPTVVGHTLNAWVSGDVIVVDHNFEGNDPVLVRIISTSGQLVQEHRFAGQPARLTLPTAELATGIWLVRISSGIHTRTFALPVLH
ncbi:MAG: PKD domain-containing protein [Flavobacteriales bacterium]|nr:PKD domain-containing protein [Flavobacteriales bacterium]